MHPRKIDHYYFVEHENWKTRVKNELYFLGKTMEFQDKVVKNQRLDQFKRPEYVPPVYLIY